MDFWTATVTIVSITTVFGTVKTYIDAKTKTAMSRINGGDLTLIEKQLNLLQEENENLKSRVKNIETIALDDDFKSLSEKAGYLPSLEAKLVELNKKVNSLEANNK